MTIANLGYQIDSAQALRAASDLDKMRTSAASADRAAMALSGSSKTAATSMESLSRASRNADIQAYGQSLDSVRAKYNPLFAAQQKYLAELRDIRQAQKVGAIDQNEMAAALGRTKTAFTAQVGAITGNSKAMELAGRRAGAMGGSMTQLSFQINDIVSGLAMGQSPFQIMTQQGGQVFQVWQMNNNIFKELKGLIVGLITPTRLLIGGLLGGAALIGAAFYSAISEQKRLEASTQGLGRTAGVTASYLHDVAMQAAHTGNATVSEAEATAMAYVKTGHAYRENIAGMIAVSKDFANATGQSAEDANAALAKMAADPVAGIDALANALGGVTGAERAHIRELVALGLRQQASNELIKVAQKNTEDYRKSLTALGRDGDAAIKAMSHSWHTLAGDINDAYNNLTLFKIEAGKPVASMENFGSSLLKSFAAMFPLAQPLTAFLPSQNDNSGTPASNTASPNQRNINQANSMATKAGASLGYDQLQGYRTDLSGLKQTIDNGFPGLDATGIKNVTEEYKRLVGAVSSLTGVRADLLAQNPSIIDGNTRIITQTDQQIQQDHLALAAVNARTPGQIAAVRRQQVYNSLIGQKISATDAARLADSAAAVAYAQAAKALSDQTRQIMANIQGTLALANAWNISSDAAMKATAHAKALTEAITNPGIDVAKRTEQYLALAKAQQTANDNERNYNLANPYEQDKRQISALRTNKNNSPSDVAFGVSQTGLGQDLFGQQAGLLNSNPFGPAASQGVDAAKASATAETQARLKIFQAARDAELISDRQFQAAKTQIEQEGAQKRAAAEQNILNARLGYASDFFGQLASLSQSKNKELAGIGKAAAIIQAEIDGVLAVQKALASYAPPYNFIMAAAVGVATAANVAKIAGFEEGGYTGNGGTSQIAGVVHGQEWVTKASGVPGNTNTLAAMNAGAKFDGARPANSNEKTNLVVEVNNYGGAQIRTEEMNDGRVRVIVDEQMRKNVDPMVAGHVSNPNSRTSKAVAQSTTAKRRRA